MATLLRCRRLSSFYESTDTNLSVLFAFFKVANKVKSALLAQKQAFYTQGGTDFCSTLFTLFHCEQERKTIL